MTENREKKTKSFSCCICGVKNDHYYTNCPESSEDGGDDSRVTLSREFLMLEDKAERNTIKHEISSLVEGRSPRRNKGKRRLSLSSDKEECMKEIIKNERIVVKTNEKAREEEKKTFYS